MPMLTTFDATAHHIDQCFAPGTHILITHGIFANEHLQPDDTQIDTVPNK